jgi:hypothetical protein
LSALRQPLFTDSRAKNINGGLGCFFGFTGIYVYLFLGRLIDEGRSQNLPGLPRTGWIK